MSVRQLLDACGRLEREQTTAARVRAVGDDGLLLVQIAGRGVDVPVRPAGDVKPIVGSEVLLVQSGRGYAVIAESPFVSSSPSYGGSLAGGAAAGGGLPGLGPFEADDFEGFDDAVSAQIDVARNTANAHARQHAIQSAADHSDVSEDAATTGDVLAYSSSAWRPTASAVRPVPRWARYFLTMGM